MTLLLGCHDPGIADSDLQGFLTSVKTQAGLSDNRFPCDAGFRRLVETADRALSVAESQRVLVNAGFFPGGKIDGIFGYRTHSATRLFQEYVRAYENKSLLPDGIIGPKTRKQLLRWRDSKSQANWSETIKRWARSQQSKTSSYTAWLKFLTLLKKHHAGITANEQKLVNAFKGKTDTLPREHWAFDKQQVHLIGVRRKDQEENRKFDDIFVLLIRGLVFKFQGSTDPGHTNHKDGAPFLVGGQHLYRFGLHKSSYHALRPMNFDRHGVLIVRSKGDFKLSPADLKRGVSVNGTINIHWGGKGVGRPVSRWSEGCQVIAGSGYEDHQGNAMNCSSYVATNNTEVKKTKGKKTRAAYNVLGDLIIALGSGLPAESEVRFTLINESDCALDTVISNEISKSLQAARKFISSLS